jgi:hypothetical protein
VLIQLNLATKRPVRDALVDGWLACAPPSLADDFIERTSSSARRRARRRQ